MCWPQALKHLSLAQNAFVPRTKSVRLNTINACIFYLEGGLANPQKRTETREKVSVKLHFNKDGPEKRIKTRQR